MMLVSWCIAGTWPDHSQYKVQSLKMLIQVIQLHPTSISRLSNIPLKTGILLKFNAPPACTSRATQGLPVRTPGRNSPSPVIPPITRQVSKMAVSTRQPQVHAASRSTPQHMPKVKKSNPMDRISCGCLRPHFSGHSSPNRTRSSLRPNKTGTDCLNRSNTQSPPMSILPIINHHHRSKVSFLFTRFSPSLFDIYFITH